MADVKTLPPVHVTAADLLEAFRQQPVVLREAQQKVDRERAAASAKEFDSWKHIRDLRGVVSCDSSLCQTDTGTKDELGRPIIKSILFCKVVLENGKEITAEAYAQAMLDKRITELVYRALGVTSAESVSKPWVPLAKVFGSQAQTAYA